ncbi:putative beta-lysine N-acetyltransferase [Alkaliflexus imshenetskii]|uniref:putative beta-lysine N-acetyltransferase n=1 Tax=Alkaliflexus imshenetskii TaxID=286730 RepID=UPI001F1C3909|nr:putative beta-lysine N-acetyltransferase [Alkaliflexus imshenetskii]
MSAEIQMDTKQYKKMVIKSKISHDAGSKRVYLMELDAADFPHIIPHIEKLAKENGYTKLFAKIPAMYAPVFLLAGYVMEAAIPGFYNDEEDAFFMVRYTHPDRAKPESEALEVFQQMMVKPERYASSRMDECYTLRPLIEEDAERMVPVFKEVFETYPFPIFDASYLVHAMRNDETRFFGVFQGEALVAISSAECNGKLQNAEMTDFAVLPSHRGKRLAVHLLTFMEKQLTLDGFKTFYTIARLHSPAMNKTFQNLEYRYAGTLTNNTQISGKIESMNVWYKKAVK